MKHIKYLTVFQLHLKGVLPVYEQSRKTDVCNSYKNISKWLLIITWIENGVIGNYENRSIRARSNRRFEDWASILGRTFQQVLKWFYEWASALPKPECRFLFLPKLNKTPLPKGEKGLLGVRAVYFHMGSVSWPPFVMVETPKASCTELRCKCLNHDKFKFKHN